MRNWGRRLTAFLLAVLVTTALASLGHSLFVQAELAALGTELPFSTRLGAIVRDFAGLGLPLGGITAVALFVGFIVGAFLQPRAGVLGIAAYPLAGLAAMAMALFLMKLSFGFSPLAGARTVAGFIVMSLSGIAGGLVYARMARQRA
jgi:hypothetical protein